MRNAFSDELTKIASERKDVVLLSADIGNKLFDRLKEKAPGRVINTGVAEANTIGVAAGLAMSGMRPIAYTITPFITTRCLEQVRVDLGYHHLPVLIVGVGAGLGYAELGATHHSCEDISFLRSIPGMTVLCPGDPWEVRSLLRAALSQKGPVYMRIGKKGEPLVHANIPALEIGKAFPVHLPEKNSGEGKGSVCILSTGNTLPLCVETAKSLESQGFRAAAVSFHTVKPLDTAFLKSAFSDYDVVATLEEHSLIGGFGSAVAEWLADQDHSRASRRASLARFGTKDEFMHLTGDQEYSREHHGITREAMEEKIKSVLHPRAGK